MLANQIQRKSNREEADRSEIAHRAGETSGQLNASRSVGDLLQLRSALNAPLRPLLLPASGPVIQRYYQYTATGGVEFILGSVPKGYVELGKTSKGIPIYGPPPSTAAPEEESKEAEPPLRRRRDFSRAERNRLASIPKVTTREDHDFTAKKGKTGQNKSQLTENGLKPAGGTNISSIEQLDQDSDRKYRGNLISSKSPLPSGQEDRSQVYGGGREVLGIKARKLERARLRGKPDAQRNEVITNSEILSEIGSSGLGREDKARFRAYALKDRELQTRGKLAKRFLILPDGSQIHDSDSESDSEDEAPSTALSKPKRREEKKEKEPEESAVSEEESNTNYRPDSVLASSSVVEDERDAPVPLTASSSVVEHEEEPPEALEEPSVEVPAAADKPKRRRRRKKKNKEKEVESDG